MFNTILSKLSAHTLQLQTPACTCTCTCTSVNTTHIVAIGDGFIEVPEGIVRISASQLSSAVHREVLDALVCLCFTYVCVRVCVCVCVVGH